MSEQPTPKPTPPGTLHETAPVKEEPLPGAEEPLDPAVAGLLADAIRAELKAALPHFDSDDIDFMLDTIDHRRIYVDGRIDVDRIIRFAKRFAPAQTTEPEAEGEPAEDAADQSTRPPTLGSILRLPKNRDDVASRREASKKPVFRRR